MNVAYVVSIKESYEVQIPVWVNYNVNYSTTIELSGKLLKKI